MTIQPEEARTTDKLQRAIAERDTARRIAAEAMCLMTEDQLLQLKRRMDELERGIQR